MSAEDGVVPMDAYLRARRDRADAALITMFASVLNTPLERRELTPEQRARREARIAARRTWLAARHEQHGVSAPRSGTPVPRPRSHLTALPPA